MLAKRRGVLFLLFTFSALDFIPGHWVIEASGGYPHILQAYRLQSLLESDDSKASKKIIQ
ncbi:hypothetical protein [Nitrosomonas sp.]|uniref:hypothetical protein n=1 Tax=Nitrosomonas sp. TaxID=42353 RepID=UPI002847C7D1|nr:hypothetical protein [Nitrosomonas sp.]MDR4513705.1 hypothetical protein [Nitrosomonas sp.]